MGEPNSTTEKAADAPPGGPSTVADDARASGEHGTESAPVTTIDPETVVETSGTSEVRAEFPHAPEPVLRDRPSTGSKKARAAAADPIEGARPLAAYELLARSARLGDLVALTKRIVTDAAQARTPHWSFGAKVAAAADDAKITHDDAATKFGNVLDVLGTGGEGTAERALASALWAHAVAESPRSRAEDEDRLAGDILWLATHTAFDATPLLDRALGDEAADLWTAIADRIRRIDRDRGGALGRGEAAIGCAALAESTADNAAQLCATLATELRDPILLRVLATRKSSVATEVSFDGEIVPAPRGFVATTLLACTGILFLGHAVRLFARAALAYRNLAEVSLSEAGVRIKTRRIMLGRTLREREHVIAKSGLVRVVREVRFPRVAFYAGLLALALGSYVGVRTFVDGVRAASPSLLLVGLIVVGVGVALDFVLGSLVPGARGQCRLAFVPRTGSTICVGNVDLHQADAAIARALANR
jgi:hypothetical protein